ncbi:MAG TPA: M20 family metallo-hydrolase [Tepidisphaeraceae bacterium]|jgi:N-carbamoyl-L-amino-acid hydrolase
MNPPLQVDTARTGQELETLASFSDAPAPAVTRVLFTEQDVAARAYLKGLMAQAGLTIRQDAVGNLFGRWPGTDPDIPAVATGSHTDAIPHSGRFDGTVGVLGGLEAIRALQRAGVRLRRSIELIMFTAEEPTRFGLGCLGSRLLSGSLDPARAATLCDSEGRSLEQVRTQAGLDEALSTVPLPTGHYDAFVELHIEQGPILEREGIDIGVVTAIAAPATIRISLRGAGGHAGATLMPGRRDAFLAAAEVGLAVERAALKSNSPDAVATTGICRIHPAAVNSIPSQAQLEIDVRDTKLDVRDAIVDAIRAATDQICARRNIEFTVEILNADPPATCAASIISAIDETCQDAQLSSRRMVSRAYHDSLFMARITPTAMIFIPCRRGVSHRPDEYASPDAIQRGILALAGTLARLAS